MSKRKLPHPGEAFLEAAWVEQQAIEKEHLLLVALEFHPATRRGVFCFHLTAEGPIVDKGLLCKVASVKMEYPNPQNGTLEGFLFAQMIKLGQMCAEFRAKEKAPLADV